MKIVKVNYKDDLKRDIKRKRVILNLIFFIMALLVVVGVIMFLYSYFAKVEGKDGTFSSISSSVFNFDSSLFALKTYNIEIYPNIVNLLGTMKTGLILVIIFLPILMNIVLIRALIKKSILKNIFELEN